MSQPDNARQTQVLQLLRDLGRTPDEVADVLARQCITGVPDDPHCCPIANYLEQSGVPVTFVNSMEVRAWGEPMLVFDEVPEPVAAFIKAFDAWPYDFHAVIDEQWLDRDEGWVEA